MSRKLDDLTSTLQPLAYEFLARCTEAKIPLLIVDTLRTMREHRANLKSGASKVTFSLHLPRKVRTATWAPAFEHMDMPDDEDKSDAIDIVPLSEFQRLRPTPPTPRVKMKLLWHTHQSGVLLPAWTTIGRIVRSIDGLEWGGSWRGFKDYGHIQLSQAKRGL